VVLILLLAACSGRQDRVPRPQDRCAELRAAPPPELTAAEPAPPESRVAVDVEVGIDRLRREVSARVPVELARSRGQSIGIAGRVSYRVTRGDFAFELEGDHLVVTTPISVEVEVCKPLGPICVTYGSCQPRLQARVRVPLTLGSSYELGKSEVTVGMTQGCVIAGFDATGRVQSIAAEQGDEARRRVDGALGALGPRGREAWREIGAPIAIGADACLRVRPDSFAQGRPALASGVLSTRVGATGRLTLEQPCAAGPVEITADPPAPAPPADVPETTVLRVPITIGWAEVARGFGAVRARGTRDHGEPRVALEMNLRDCAAIWVVGEPWYDAVARRVRLRRVGSPAFDTHAGVALPKEVDEVKSGLALVMTQLDEAVDAKLGPLEVTDVSVTTKGLVATVTVRGTVRVRVR
jgi:hypothetical protein